MKGTLRVKKNDGVIKAFVEDSGGELVFEMTLERREAEALAMQLLLVAHNE